LCPLEYRGCATPGGLVTPKNLYFLWVFGLKKLSPPTVLIGLSWFLVILYNAPTLKFYGVIFCNFHLAPKLWRHKWRHLRFCKSCRRAMRFPPFDSSEDFMRRGGLRFSLSLIVSQLWRHQWRHNERCELHPRPWSVAASWCEKLSKCSVDVKIVTFYLKLTVFVYMMWCCGSIIILVL